MKTNYFGLFVLGLFLLSACNVGVNKDLLSGLKITNSGLTYKEAYLSLRSAKVTNTEFSVGDTIYLYSSGVEGFTEKEGKVYLGASMVITDPNGKPIMNEPDMFKDYDATGVSKEDASVISLRFIPLPAIAKDVKYLWKSRIWDKNGKGEINAEVEFTVK